MHGTAVAVDGAGVLLMGPSGSGKSDMALRLIDRGATLVSDDQTLLRHDGARIVLSAPADLAGLLEVRGVGIVQMEEAGATPLHMIVELVPASDVDRLPHRCTRNILDLEIPCVRLDPREPAAPIKVRLALSRKGLL